MEWFHRLKGWLTGHLIAFNPRRLWIRYFLAVFLIVALITGSHLASVIALRKTAQDAAAIMIADRQRMLSQRILYLAGEVLEDPGEQNRDNLSIVVDLFETSHQDLVNRDDLTPSLQRLYFENGDFSVDHMVRNYISFARAMLLSDGNAMADTYLELEKMGQSRLLIYLNETTSEFSDVSRSQLDRLRRIENVALGVAIVILFLEGLLIFWPAHRAVNKALERLESQKNSHDEARVIAEQRSRDLEKANERITHAANHDSLTELANRVKLKQYLTDRLAELKGKDTTFAVMHIDLDHFKEINDTLGHAVGDEVLRHAARRLKDLVTDKGLAARIGGDEFVIVTEVALPEHGLDKVGAELVNAIKEPVVVDGNECRVSATIGYRVAAKRDTDPARLISDADIALYEAKRTRRGTVLAFSKTMRDAFEERQTLLTELYDAIEAKAFAPFFQPQIHLESGKLAGFEMLARWRNPRLGLLTPDKFLQLAEDAGLVDKIDEIVLANGLDLMAKLRAEGRQMPRVSINASAKTLRDPTLVEKLEWDLENRGLEPSNLVVEILESTMIADNSDIAAQNIQRLSKAGFGVEIDDFGTGYAAMSTLSNLAIDGVKLDRSLIMTLPDPGSESIVRAIIALAKELKLSVIAEGVESPAHFSLLRKLKCDMAQGYGIAKPLAFEDLVPWLQEFDGAGQQKRAG